MKQPIAQFRKMAARIKSEFDSIQPEIETGNGTIRLSLSIKDDPGFRSIWLYRFFDAGCRDLMSHQGNQWSGKDHTCIFQTVRGEEITEMNFDFFKKQLNHLKSLQKVS